MGFYVIIYISVPLTTTSQVFGAGYAAELVLAIKWRRMRGAGSSPSGALRQRWNALVANVINKHNAVNTLLAHTHAHVSGRAGDRWWMVWQQGHGKQQPEQQWLQWPRLSDLSGRQVIAFATVAPTTSHFYGNKRQP